MRVTTQTSDMKGYLKFNFINFYFSNEKYMLNTCYIVIYKIHLSHCYVVSQIEAKTWLMLRKLRSTKRTNAMS